MEQWVEEDDLETDYLEEQELEQSAGAEIANQGYLPALQQELKTTEQKSQAIREEINELNGIITLAQGLQTDTKAKSLLTALQLGFANMTELGAPRKAIIFTESKRTQGYLYQFLAANGYDGKLAMFSGTNNHPDTTVIYQQWLADYQGTDRVTGSPQVDRRTALIDHFRKDDGTGADIMIATEAAARR
ncbi:MAG: hypothetical protein M1356_01435 [Gammaproteobacteria bacterium]|nr:hypothetical protein [Gammaproteobacteria bacterium]